jgi:outer membrane lipoprotein-sorting protein
MVRRLMIILAPVLTLALLLPAYAQEPDLKTVLKKTKEIFEPSYPCRKRVVITMSDSPAQIVAGIVSKSFPDGKRMVTVVLEPKDLRGFAFMVQEKKDGDDLMWVYVPAIRRTKMIRPVQQMDSFLGTDLTYGEFGFLKIDDKASTLSEDKLGGAEVYKVEEKVTPERTYYSKIVTWISKETMLPIQRDFYDVAGQLWKSGKFESITNVEGVPTPLHLVVKDVMTGTSTELKVTDVACVPGMSDEIFSPGQLPKLADDELWQAPPLESAKEK